MAIENEPIPPMHFYGPTDAFGFGQLGEIWRTRELLYSFFLRDLLIRYRQVLVGVLWVLLPTPDGDAHIHGAVFCARHQSWKFECRLVRAYSFDGHALLAIGFQQLSGCDRIAGELSACRDQDLFSAIAASVS